MTTINLVTNIRAPIKRCFDLSRSIDLHQLSTKGTDEKGNRWEDVRAHKGRGIRYLGGNALFHPPKIIY